MKRSKSVNLASMRKAFSVKPIALAVASLSLAACSEPRRADLYKTSEDCATKNPGLEEECKAQFEKALAESERTAPRYEDEASCVAEFGIDACRPVPGPTGQSWFMPAMAGFMLGRAMDRNDGYYYRAVPVYTSYRRTSPMYGKWTTADGRSYGSVNRSTTAVSSSTFKPKPAVTKTISRGGFGSTVAAKARFGGGG